MLNESKTLVDDLESRNESTDLVRNEDLSYHYLRNIKLPGSFLIKQIEHN